MILLLLFLKLTCSGECTDITFVDSTGIAVCNSKRIMRNRVFRDLSETGKSSMGRFFGFKQHPACNDRDGLLNFYLTVGNADDRNTDVFSLPGRNLSGKPYGDKGYMSSSLPDLLFCDSIHLVTGTGSSMKNRLMSLRDKILLRKRSVIETINDEPKNICRVEHSRHRGTASFLISLLAGLAACCFFDKNPAIRFDRNLPDGQLSLFY